MEKLNKKSWKKIAKEVLKEKEAIRSGEKRKLFEIDVNCADYNIVGQGKILFKPDGYIHGKKGNAISGWLLDKNGYRWLRIILKRSYLRVPDAYTIMITMPGVNIAGKREGKYWVLLQREVNGIQNEELYAINRVLLLYTYKKLWKRTLREKIKAKILGWEVFADVNPGNTGEAILDLLLMPKNRIRKALQLLTHHEMATKVLDPIPQYKEFQIPEDAVKMRKFWRIARRVDLPLFEDLVRIHRDKRAPTKAFEAIKTKYRNYGRKSNISDIYAAGAVLNMLETRIGIVKTIMKRYVGEMNERTET